MNAASHNYFQLKAQAAQLGIDYAVAVKQCNAGQITPAQCAAVGEKFNRLLESAPPEYYWKLIEARSAGIDEAHAIHIAQEADLLTCGFCRDNIEPGEAYRHDNRDHYWHVKKCQLRNWTHGPIMRWDLQKTGKVA